MSWTDQFFSKFWPVVGPAFTKHIVETEQEVRSLLQLLRLRREARILDVPCGFGRPAAAGGAGRALRACAFTPPRGEVNSPLRRQTAPLPILEDRGQISGHRRSARCQQQGSAMLRAERQMNVPLGERLRHTDSPISPLQGLPSGTGLAS